MAVSCTTRTVAPISISSLGPGALNYGHNNSLLKRALIEYLRADGITHGLDMCTVAKRRFLETFVELVLKPRNLDYKIQCPGPTGAHSVEAALMLARKVTGRQTVINFTDAFHGMTLGASAVSHHQTATGSGAIAPVHTQTMPYDDPFARLWPADGPDAAPPGARRLEAGEHSGTFRGNNAAFVTATAALEIYWADDALAERTLANGDEICRVFDAIVAAYPSLSLQARGRGLARGLAFADAEAAGQVCAAAFERGLLIETSGRQGEVAKVMPPLTMTGDELQRGLLLLDEAIATIGAPSVAAQPAGGRRH